MFVSRDLWVMNQFEWLIVSSGPTFNILSASTDITNQTNDLTRKQWPKSDGGRSQHDPELQKREVYRGGGKSMKSR